VAYAVSLVIDPNKLANCTVSEVEHIAELNLTSLFL